MCYIDQAFGKFQPRSRNAGLPTALSAAFASNLDHLVERADLWIHGHTHDNFDYQLGRCRVVCNPRGYVWERHGGNGHTVENPEFNPGLVVEV